MVQSEDKEQKDHNKELQNKVWSLMNDHEDLQKKINHKRH
jgi:hypothetical protein